MVEVIVPSLAGAQAQFAAWTETRSRETARAYRTAVARFFDFLRGQGIDPETVRPGALPETILETFFQWLAGRYGRSTRSTTGVYLAGTRAFFRFLDRHGWGPSGASYEKLSGNLRDAVGRETPYPTPRTDPAIARLVVAAQQAELPTNSRPRLTLRRDRALLQLLYSTGVRRAELCNLTRRDVQDGRATRVIITGKGEKDRVIFIDEETRQAIRAYLTERNDSWQPLFLRHDNARPKPGPSGMRLAIAPITVWRVVVHWAKVAGVDAHPHLLRHLKATVLLNRGAKLSEVQDILGHASPETTKRIYAHYEVNHLEEAFIRYSVPAEQLVVERGPGDT